MATSEAFLNFQKKPISSFFFLKLLKISLALFIDRFL